MSVRHVIFIFPAEISCPFICSLNIFLTEVLMNTKTETSDLKWTIFSTAKPEVRNPSFTMLSVLLTRTVWWLGIFGFQLFLCYFGYKGVPYMAGNWQNKGRPEWVWDSKYIGSRCFDISHQPWSWTHWLPTSFEYCSQKTTYLQFDQLRCGC